MKSLVSKVKNNEFFKGSVVFTSATFAVNILSYVANLIIARLFPLEIYGEFSATISFTAIFAVPLTSLGLIVINAIGKHQKEEQENKLDQLTSQLSQFINTHRLLLASAAFAGTALLTYGINLRISSAIFIIVNTALSIWFTFYYSALQAFKKFGLSSLYLASSTIFRIVLLIIASIIMPNLESIYISYLIPISIIILYSKTRLFKRKTSDIHKSVSLKKILDKKITYPFIGTLGMVAILSTDVILAKKFMSDADASLYASLAMMGKMITYITTPFTLVAFTFFSSKDKGHSQKNIGTISLAVLLLVGICMITAYALIPEFIVTLIFGSKYISISPIVWIAGIYGTVYAIANALTYFEIAKVSKRALYPAFAGFAQIAALAYFHQSYTQVLTVNIVILVLLIAAYATTYIRGILDK